MVAEVDSKAAVAVDTIDTGFVAADSTEVVETLLAAAEMTVVLVAPNQAKMEVEIAWYSRPLLKIFQ